MTTTDNLKSSDKNQKNHPIDPETLYNTLGDAEMILLKSETNT